MAKIEYSVLVQPRIAKSEGITSRQIWAWASVVFVFVLLSVSVYMFLPMGMDWRNTYRPAALHLLRAESPYLVSIFHSPPWTVLPLLPLALLPTQVGFAINFSLSMAATAYVAYRMGAKPLTILALLLSYPVLFMAAYGQIDWLVYLGFLMPPQLGLFFVLIKPQVSIGIVLFWGIEAFRRGGAKQVFRVFWPVSLALGMSFLFFGNWFSSSFSEIERGFNASFWPQSIPIGLVLLYHALRKRNVHLSMTTSPFLSPYLAPHGWGVALLGLSSSQWECVAACSAVWILRLMTGEFL
jgi:hypothetical protein